MTTTNAKGVVVPIDTTTTSMGRRRSGPSRRSPRTPHLHRSGRCSGGACRGNRHRRQHGDPNARRRHAALTPPRQSARAIQRRDQSLYHGRLPQRRSGQHAGATRPATAFSTLAETNRMRRRPNLRYGGQQAIRTRCLAMRRRTRSSAQNLPAAPRCRSTGSSISIARRSMWWNCCTSPATGRTS